MDVEAILRHQLPPRPPRSTPPRCGCVDHALRWLLAGDDPDEHLEWGFGDARRLLFVRWLAEHGRLSS